MKSANVSSDQTGTSILQPSWKENMIRLLQGRQAAPVMIESDLAQDSEVRRVPFGMEFKLTDIFL
jgi:hypothetical protein